MKACYTHHFDRISLQNRWKYNKWRGLHIDFASDWTILGIAQRFFSPLEYEYIIAFFGFELRIWMIRTPK